MNSVPRPLTSPVLGIAGVRGRLAPATWTQSRMWQVIRLSQRDQSYNLSGLVPVPVGCDLRDVLTAGHEVLRRYEALRTTFQSDGDRLSQLVWAEGEFRVDLYQTTAEHSQHLATRIAEQLETRPFAAHTQAVTGQPSAADKWPVRFAVVLTAGRPAFVVVGFSHLALDAGGAVVVAQEMSRLLAGGAADRTPVWQPADLAAWEQSPQGRAASDRATNYLRQVLRSAPPTMYDLPLRKPESPRFFCLQMESEAAGEAAVRLARRLHLSTTSAVFLAATAVVLGQYSGRTGAVLQLICANRTDEPQRTLAAHLAQPVPCWLDFTGLSFDQIVGRAFDASVSASLHSQHNFADVSAAIQGEELTVGRHIDLNSFFNYLQIGPPMELRVSEQEIDDLVAKTVITEELLAKRDRFWIQVSPSSRQIMLQCDTAYIPKQSMSEMLYGIERLLVAGATRDLPATKLPAIAAVRPADRGPSWIKCHEGYSDLSASRLAWQEVVGTDLANVYAEAHADADETQSHRLVAYVAAHDDRSVATLHRRLVHTLREQKRTDVRAPDWYIRCGRTRLPPTDQHSWANIPVIEEGTGRPGIRVCR